MKLSITHIAFISQSVFLLILFFIIIFKKSPEPYINYKKIKEDMKENIVVLKKEFDSLKNENKSLYKKIDSIKFLIPNNKENLAEISREINKLKDAYTTNNYSDSSDVALISRLSK